MKKIKFMQPKKEREEVVSVQKISVVINTYNADRLLETAIKSVIKADEIIICDMHSTDRTVEIAQKYNCKIYYHEKLPQPDPARNFALSKATGDWILILDSDEVVSEDLWNELVFYANNPYKNHYVLNLSFKTYFLNGFLKHLQPEFHLRYFKRGHLKYEDGFVHIKPLAVDSEILALKSSDKDLNIYHYTYGSIEQFLEKWNIYTSEEIKKIDSNKTDVKPHISTIVRMYISAMIKFFARGAYKDGFRGFVWCLYAAIYRTSTYLKLLEKADNWGQKQNLDAQSRSIHNQDSQAKQGARDC